MSKPRIQKNVRVRINKIECGDYYYPVGQYVARIKSDNFNPTECLMCSFYNVCQLLEVFRKAVHDHIELPQSDAPPDGPIEKVCESSEGELPDNICECGLGKVMESCHACLGRGGYHDCGEDTCCCLDKSDNIICEECEGHGEYLVCPNAEAHYKEQRTAENSKPERDDEVK